MRHKATFRSNKTKAPIQQFACIQEAKQGVVYMPLHGFTAVDLGYQPGDAVSNLVTRIDEPAFTATYLQLFDQIWHDPKPVRFIFSHSALREGWDNPNVFVMCMLKHSDNTISRRQEVGRGLRLAVNQQGERMDHAAIVHEINVLTVIAGESYKDFVSNLQREISDTLSSRPKKADEAYFTGKTITTAAGPLEINPAMAKQIYRYLLKNDYTDDADQITETYHADKANNILATLPAELTPYAEQIFGLIDSVFSEAQLPDVDDDRKPKTNPLNDNFEQKEFQALWQRINRKAIYRVDFDSDELIAKSIKTLDKALTVTPLQYTVQGGNKSIRRPLHR